MIKKKDNFLKRINSFLIIFLIIKKDNSPNTYMGSSKH